MYCLTGKESLSPRPDSKYTEMPSKQINKNQPETVKSWNSIRALYTRNVTWKKIKEKRKVNQLEKC